MNFFLFIFFNSLTMLQALTPSSRPVPETVGVKLIAKGFDRPVGVKFDSENRAYVVEQTGRVRVVEDGKILPEPFLDVSDRSTRVGPFGSEQGLLDIAFPPDYPKKNIVFVHYTDRDGNTVLSNFLVKNGKADYGSEQTLLFYKQPYSNHNGGQIEFGPDGFLYMGLGDGGSAGDPKGNGQNLKTLLGKILRLDVRSSSSYQNPPDNPFFKESFKGRALAEIWAYGLRNPWRFSFDGRFLYIGDVGQKKWEEINIEDIRQGGGKNYGWSILEGRQCFLMSGCVKKGMEPPAHVYRNGVNGDCSVIGGAVYRGELLPQLDGVYFYADYCSGILRSFRYIQGAAIEHKEWRELNPGKKNWAQVSSLGRDRKGEIYIVDYSRGALLRLTPVLK